MISCSRHAETCVVHWGAPGPGVAYVDADWLPRDGEGDVPALLCADGVLGWNAAAAVPLPPGRTEEEVAALALIRVARDALGAVAHLPAAEVEVAGRGAIAFAVRALLGAPARGAARPRALVDATGDPRRIEEATERLAPLGTLVLAGEPLGRELELDLYPDVHRRGLELVGVPPPLHAGAPRTASAEDERLAGRLRAELAPVSAGEPFRPTALWYRVAGY